MLVHDEDANVRSLVSKLMEGLADVRNGGIWLRVSLGEIPDGINEPFLTNRKLEVFPSTFPAPPKSSPVTVSCSPLRKTSIPPLPQTAASISPHPQ